MILRFDELKYNPKKSMNTTLNSLSFSQHYHSRPTTPNIHAQKLLTQFTYSDQRRKTDKNYRDLVSPSHPNSAYKTKSYLHMNNYDPKKYAQIKSFQEIKSFIQAMDEGQLYQQKKTSIPKKISQPKSSNSFNFILKNLSNQSQSKNKQQNKIEAITQRLYNNNKRRSNNNTNANCKREACKSIITTEQRHSDLDLKNFTGKPVITSSKKKKLQSKLYRSLDNSLQKSLESSFSTRSKEKSGIHIKLYEDSKLRELKMKSQRQSLFKKQLQKYQQTYKNIKKDEKYAQNYRGFYQRLDQLVSWRQNRSKLYDQLNLSSSGEIMFQPNWENKLKCSSKQRSKTKDKQFQKELHQKFQRLSKNKLKCSKLKCHQNQKKLIKQKNKQQQKFVLNSKSVQIVEDHEKKFIKKMKEIFYNKKHQKITINQDKIAQLNDKQFDILFDLFLEMQNKSGQVYDQNRLQKQINSFYKNLDPAKKQQLRRLQILKACKAKVNKGHFNNKKIDQPDNLGSFGTLKNLPLKGHLKKFLSQKQESNGVDYCAKLTEFV